MLGLSQQDILEKDITFKLDGDLNQAAETLRSNGRRRVVDILTRFDIDVIIGPADSLLSSIAAMSGSSLHPYSFPLANRAGLPTACLPLSYLELNGRPFGLQALANAHREDLLVQVMSAWEATFPSRQPPKLEIP